MKRWPWRVAGASLALVLVAAVAGDASWIVTPWALPILACLMVGAVLASRVSDNTIGPLLLAFGITGLIGLSIGPLITFVPRWAAWMEDTSYVLSTAVIVVFPLIILRYPDGRLPGPKWRPVEIAIVATGLIGGSAALINGGWGGDPRQAVYPSPLRESLGPVGDVLSATFFALLLLGLAASVFAVGLRHRRADQEERAQIRWLWYSAGVLVAAGMAVGGAATDAWEQWLMSIAFASIPAAIGVAVTKYRLYDLDLVISRTLLIGILGVFVSGVYVVVVVGIGSLLGRTDDLLLSVGSTALVALLFEPVRARGQKWANRFVFGSRATPYEVLSDLTARLSRAESHEGLFERMAERLAHGTGADRAAVWVRHDNHLEAVAVYPEGPAPGPAALEAIPGSVVPIESEGELLGALSIETRRDEALTPNERRLTEDLAHATAAVLGRARLDAALSERARELAESRRRLIGAEEGERRRIERTLDEGVQQQVLGLKLGIGLVAQEARGQGAEKTATMLESVAEDAQAAIHQIRTLARGVFPPLLASDGLGTAITAIVERTPVESTLRIGEIGRTDLGVEAAMYFSMTEAITNAAKHGDEPLEVTLERTADEIRFCVADSGPGFDPSTVQRGAGLTNLVDRMEGVGGTLRIHSAPGQRTIVEGRVPSS